MGLEAQLEEELMFHRKSSWLVLVWMIGMIAVSFYPLVDLPDVGEGGDSEHPAPAQGTWSSLWEGDGVNPPSAEGWWLRPWGTTSIYSAVSDGETVAVVDDPDPIDGAWMQKWVDLEPPFEFAARGRYDPMTARTSPVTIAWMFTGCHRMFGQIYPTKLRIGGPQPFEVPAVQGEWYNLTFDVKAPLDVDVYSNGLFIGNVEMDPQDRLSFDPPDNKPGVATIITGIPTAKGMVDYVRTTMEPIQEVGPKVCDRQPPLVLNLTLDDGIKTPSDDLLISESVSLVWLNATVDDETRGNSSIWSANYTIGASNWPGTALSASDGAFDSPVEDVTAMINVSGLPEGDYTVCVYGRDYYGNWDQAGSCAILRIGKQEPPRIDNLTLDDGVQLPSSFLEVALLPTTNVWLNATIDDTLTGDSTIASADYLIGTMPPWISGPMSPSDGGFDSSREDVTAMLDPYVLGTGNHTVCVFASDIAGNVNWTCGNLKIAYVAGGSLVNPLLQYWWREQVSLTASSSDGSFPVVSVDLCYNYSADSTNWFGWVFHDTAVTSPWTWSFTFPEGEGFYGFYSIARDANGIEEVPPIGPETIVGYDATPPSSSVQPLAPYWRSTDTVGLAADASDALSGVANVTFHYRFSDDNATWTDWSLVSTDTTQPYEATFVASNGDGFYQFRSDAVDMAGNVENDTDPEAWVAIDRQGPLSQILQPSWYWTNASNIQLDALGSDALSGIAQIELHYRFSPDNSTWSGWNLWDIDSTAPWTYTFDGNEGDGYYEFRSRAEDLLGNSEVSLPTADALIAWDTAPPTGSVVIDGGGEWTGSTSVTLTLTFSDSLSGVALVRYSNDGIFDAEPWHTPSGTMSWTLTGDHGTNTVWYQLIDRAGNIHTVSDNIGLDLLPPVSSLGPLSGYWWAGTPIQLFAQASDDLSGVDTVELFWRWSADNITFSSWTSAQALAAPPWSFALDPSEGDGFYELMTLATDLVGNDEVGNLAELSLALDTTPPQTEALPVVPYNRATTPITINAQGSDALSGLATMQLTYRYSEDNLSWTPWRSLGQVTGPPNEWNFSAPDGEGYYEFYTQGRDVLGNAEEVPDFADSCMAYFVGSPPPDGDGTEGALEENWKPFMALIFTIVILIVASVLLSRARTSGLSGRRSKMLLAAAILFSALEIVTGAVSMVIPALRIPPAIGAGSIIDITILAVGLGILLFLALKGEATDDRDEHIPPPPPDQ